jgi:hypothetical protein
VRFWPGKNCFEWFFRIFLLRRHVVLCGLNLNLLVAEALKSMYIYVP